MKIIGAIAAFTTLVSPLKAESTYYKIKSLASDHHGLFSADQCLHGFDMLPGRLQFRPCDITVGTFWRYEGHFDNQLWAYEGNRFRLKAKFDGADQCLTACEPYSGVHVLCQEKCDASNEKQLFFVDDKSNHILSMNFKCFEYNGTYSVKLADCNSPGYSPAGTPKYEQNKKWELVEHIDDYRLVPLGSTGLCVGLEETSRQQDLRYFECDETNDSLLWWLDPNGLLRPKGGPGPSFCAIIDWQSNSMKLTQCDNSYTNWSYYPQTGEYVHNGVCFPKGDAIVGKEILIGPCEFVDEQLGTVSNCEGLKALSRLCITEISDMSLCSQYDQYLINDVNWNTAATFSLSACSGVSELICGASEPLHMCCQNGKPVRCCEKESLEALQCVHDCELDCAFKEIGEGSGSDLQTSSRLASLVAMALTLFLLGICAQQ